MAFYCNGKKGVCDTYPVCKRSCEYFDNSGGKHIADLSGKRITTNADRIRAMSDEELADFITSQNRGICTDICREMHYQSNLEWLKQPAEE